MAMSRKLSFSAVLKGDALDYVSMLAFCDPKSFVAGVLHRHSGSWSRIASLAPCDLAVQVLNCIENYVDVLCFFPTFQRLLQRRIL